MMHPNTERLGRAYSAAKIILVVEDDDNIGTFLVEALSQETPYTAVLVTDGFAALKAVHDIKPALFITDYRLPLMDGIELYDRLHVLQGLENIPIIIMSAYLPKEEIKKRNLISLSKPFELDDLLNAINRLLA